MTGTGSTGLSLYTSGSILGALPMWSQVQGNKMVVDEGGIVFTSI